MSGSSSSSDRDLASIQEARALARRARSAQQSLAELDQSRIDQIVDAMAVAAAAEAEPLARLACEETGYGVTADKIRKNLFAARRVSQFIRPMKTVGVVRRRPDEGIVEIAEPFGVVAAVVPSTNPTSTTIYKCLIAIKARCAIVLSPHPAAVGCITTTAELMMRAGREAGLPEDAIVWMTTVTIEGTQALMTHRDVAVILATGGLGLVRAAYSAGKPAYGVGPGNAPAYVDRSADVRQAIRHIVAGKTFDNGVLCSSENSVVVDTTIADNARRAFEGEGGRFLTTAEAAALAAVLVTPQRLPNPELVGRPAVEIAARAGIPVADDTRLLIAELDGVGRDHPLSIEKLCPVLSFFVVDDWRKGCERCKEILRYGGMGHTMSIHSRDDGVILEFGLRKPASRIVVNTSTTHGSIGLTTGLDPAMTLGCGGFGGNITSDNISPRHLLNIKRLAYALRSLDEIDDDDGTGERPAPARPGPQTIDAETLSRRVDAFLATRGLARPTARPGTAPPPPTIPTPTPIEPLTSEPPPPGQPTAPATPPVEFVCEDDVRQAVEEGRRIVVDEQTIITPAARDLAHRHRVFTYVGL